MKSTTRATGTPGGLALRVDDGLSNVVTGMGYGRDRQAFNRWTLGSDIAFGPSLIGVDQIEAAYRTSALVRIVHDLIPEEMTREWRQWSTDAETIVKIEAEEKRLNVVGAVFEALRLARLTGGCGLIMGLPGNPEEEAPATVGVRGLTYLIPMPRTLLQIDDLDRDLLSPFFMQPTRYRINSRNSYAAIHPSRVIPFRGMPTAGTRFVTKEDEFWGHPLMEGLNDQLQNVTMGQNALAQLIPEAKTDIVSVPGLTDMVSTADGEQRLAKRLQAAKALQSMFGINLLDAGDGTDGAGEKWEQRQITWAGLPDVMRTLFQCLAAYAEVPLTRLIGDQAKGLNNGGEQDERNFETKIKTKQRRELAPKLDRLDAYMLASAGVKASGSLTYTFSPLNTPTPKEQAELDAKTAETFETLATSGLIQHDALAATAVATLSERPTFAGLQIAVEASSEEIPASARLRLEAEGAQAQAQTRMLQSSRGALRLARVSRDAFMADATARSLYVSRKVMNPQEVLNHFRAQGIEGLEAARDLHVTIACSRAAVDWMAIPADWSGDRTGRLVIAPGGPRVLELFGPLNTTLVQCFQSADLQWRHETIKEAGASFDWPEYQPHITIAKDAGDSFDISGVKPYTGRIVLGPEIFEEVLP